MQPSFTLTEQFAFGSRYSWRLKESEIRFRGSGDYESLVVNRIPASESQIGSFFSALELIQVREWRNNYDPGDVDSAAMDGSCWSFLASFENDECRCGGCNAYPSFADPKQTSMQRSRFALLCAALYDCFNIDGYIHQAKRFAEETKRLRGEKTVLPDSGDIPRKKSE